MEELTLKQKLQMLEKITEKMDDPNLDLEAAVELYSEGVKLASSCQKQLNEAKQKITELSINCNDE